MNPMWRYAKIIVHEDNQQVWIQGDGNVASSGLLNTGSIKKHNPLVKAMNRFILPPSHKRKQAALDVYFLQYVMNL